MRNPTGMPTPFDNDDDPRKFSLYGEDEMLDPLYGFSWSEIDDADEDLFDRDWDK